VAPSAGQVSVWDFPRPPRIEPETRAVRVEHAGVEVARAAAALRVVETAGAPTYYLKETDVDRRLLVPSGTDSFCEWKGRAVHFDLHIGGEVAAEAAWSYPDPFPEFEVIRGWLAFHPGRVAACWLGNAKVEAQAGGYYGGWVTPDLAGPIKGEAGSEAW
jgi:uncharacterized protein (DUF427 family)